MVPFTEMTAEQKKKQPKHMKKKEMTRKATQFFIDQKQKKELTKS